MTQFKYKLNIILFAISVWNKNIRKMIPPKVEKKLVVFFKVWVWFKLPKATSKMARTRDRVNAQAI